MSEQAQAPDEVRAAPAAPASNTDATPPAPVPSGAAAEERPALDSHDEIDPNDFRELEGGPDQAEGDPALPPAAPKISPSSPGLQVAGGGRRLRKRAIALVVTAATAVAAGSLLLTGKGQATQPREREEPVLIAPVPQSLLNAPETVSKPEVPPTAADDGPAPKPSVPVQQHTTVDPGRKAADVRKAKAEEQFWKARAAGIHFDTVMPAAPSRVPSRHDLDEDEPGQLAERAAGAGRSRGAGAAAGGDIFGEDPNQQDRKNRFLSGELEPLQRRRGPRIQHSRSPFELKPGMIIAAALQSAVSSDLPGPVIARVTENVCDFQGNWLLIPQGSTLVAYYDSMIAWGQERVLMCWKQLVLPNGDEMNLGCMPAADWAGKAGLNDEVDEHWWRIVKGAAVSSLLSASTAAAAGNTVGFNPTLPQLAARGAATEIGSVGQSITRRNIMIQPTLTIRQAQPVNVIITETLDFSSDTPATPCHSRQ